MLRALFALTIVDGDLHLKNLAVLRIAQPRSDRFSSVRLASAYDKLKTRIFPGMEHDAMALTLNGKRNRLSRRSGSAPASMGLTRAAASDAVDKPRVALRRHLAEVSAAGPSVIRAQDEWWRRLADPARWGAS